MLEQTRHPGTTKTTPSYNPRLREIRGVIPIVRLVCVVLVVITTGRRAAAEMPWDHGKLEIDNNHFIRHSDGKPFVYLADTAWRIWTLDPAEVRQYLDSVRDAGFTVVQVAAVYQHPGKSFGAPENYAGEAPFTDDAGTFNKPYWEHLDYIVRQAESRGLYVCMTALWGHSAGGRGKWPFFGNPSAHNVLYGQRLGRRYKTYPNIIWCAAGEFVTISGGFQGPITAGEKERLLDIARGIRGQDGVHLMTIHGNRDETARPSYYFNGDPEIDFYLNQVSARRQLIGSIIKNDWVLTLEGVESHGALQRNRH